MKRGMASLRSDYKLCSFSIKESGKKRAGERANSIIWNRSSDAGSRGGRHLKIAVCVKSVPDTEAKINVASDKLNIDLAGVRFIVSPYDEFAVEEALKLK